MVADFVLVCAPVRPGDGPRPRRRRALRDRARSACSPSSCMAGLWGLVFTGFPYAIALKTGSPAAVARASSCSSRSRSSPRRSLPREALTGWLDTVAGYNPVTYLLDGLRSLITEGWEWAALGKGLLAIALVGAGVDVAVLRRPARSRASGVDATGSGSRPSSVTKSISCSTAPTRAARGRRRSAPGRAAASRTRRGGRRCRARRARPPSTARRAAPRARRRCPTTPGRTAAHTSTNGVPVTSTCGWRTLGRGAGLLRAVDEVVEQHAEPATGPGVEVADDVGEVVHAVEPLDDDAELAEVVAPDLLDELGVVDALHEDAAGPGHPGRPGARRRPSPTPSPRRGGGTGAGRRAWPAPRRRGTRPAGCGAAGRPRGGRAGPRSAR